MFNSQTSPAGHYELISKFNVGLKTLLREGLSEPEFYGDLVYKFKKLIGRNDFSYFLFSSETSWLMTMLPSILTRRWVGRQTL